MTLDRWTNESAELAALNCIDCKSAVAACARIPRSSDRFDCAIRPEPGAELGSSMFSPDGHWVVYHSAIRGGSRIYVRSFPPSDSPYLAPQDADAHHPVWASGKELFC